MIEHSRDRMNPLGRLIVHPTFAAAPPVNDNRISFATGASPAQWQEFAAEHGIALMMSWAHVQALVMTSCFWSATGLPQVLGAHAWLMSHRLLMAQIDALDMIMGDRSAG
jgi:hypothetical protein